MFNFHNRWSQRLATTCMRLSILFFAYKFIFISAVFEIRYDKYKSINIFINIKKKYFHSNVFNIKNRRKARGHLLSRRCHDTVSRNNWKFNWKSGKAKQRKNVAPHRQWKLTPSRQDEYRDDDLSLLSFRTFRHFFYFFPPVPLSVPLIPISLLQSFQLYRMSKRYRKIFHF